MHDAGGVSGFNDGDDIETDAFVWIVELQQTLRSLDDPALLGQVNSAFGIAKSDGFPGFYFDRDKAANGISGYEVNFTFPCAEVAMQYPITKLLKE